MQRLRAAARRGDWETIRDILQAADDPDRRAFLVSACVGPGRSPAWLNTWAAAEPRSALPMLLWGEHAVTSAWVARGSGYASTVTRRGWRGFREWLAYAETCLLEAAARDPGSGRHRRSYLADPAVLADLHRAADRSVRHPDYVRPPGMPRDEAYFAVMFVACGDGPAANEMFAGLRRCVPEMPFAYSRLPVPVNFVRLRLAAALAARVRPRP